MHGRSDGTIPPKGGIDDEYYWFYESQESVYQTWANIQNCDFSSYERVLTPFHNEVPKDEMGGNLECYEYTGGCAGRVMNCNYKGFHGDQPEYDARLGYWFFNLG